MASKKAPIQRSNVLKHPLGGGRAGFSREMGLTDNKSSMLHAWSHGIRSSVIWSLEGEGSLTNIVYDQATLGAIIGLKGRNGISGGSEM